MKTIDKIPTSKIHRASRLIQTGAKVGMNYIKYYGDKMVSTKEEAKETLDESNARDIYDGLKQLKGSALKVAQMLSMEKNLLPQAYVEKFSLAQFSVPPLSAPLVIKTFRKYFGKAPSEIFDRFDPVAINAASIGQVHKAFKNDKELAIKIQYPGVAESISSDLAMVKPVAMKMFNIKGKDSDQYFKEVEGKLLEETDYLNEVRQSMAIANACSIIPDISFPSYYPELSTERIITMDWMHGKHFSEFTKQNKNTETANLIGQTLWDFYMFQVHKLRKVHADPHPGNFLVSSDKKLIVIDFGCVKEIPDDFYIPYFELAKEESLSDKSIFEAKLYELEILKPSDSKAEKKYFLQLFHELLSLFTKPFNSETFNFSDEGFFEQIANLAQKYAKSSELKNMNGNRGSRHFIYINRTFFGLFSLMHDLKCTNTIINNYRHLKPINS
jgi:predicted unusual protein kinase regulating ubiquinone biosynthesis (AarF/ABC1/UbiB family)